MIRGEKTACYSAFVQLANSIVAIVKATHRRKPMKPLTLYGLAFLLIVGTTTALAGGRGHGGHNGGHNGGHQGGHHYKYQGHHYKHYKPYRSYGYYGGHYRPDYYYPSYLGAALIGSALTSSLYHSHNGARCYEDHSGGLYQPRNQLRNQQRDSGSREVIGCHRIEILADGTERRVEMPMSQCQ
jgi:hypothetical protein